MSGCIDEIDPYYTLIINFKVGTGEVSNGTILMPLPAKDGKIFYGIEDITGAYNNLTIGITDTVYGKMLIITIKNLTRMESFTCARDFTQDESINAKNPVNDEYLLTPKFNLTTINEKIDDEFLIAIYHSMIFVQYNSIEDTQVTIRCGIEGYNEDSTSYYAYFDKIEDLDLRGPQTGWLTINGSISRRDYTV